MLTHTPDRWRRPAGLTLLLLGVAAALVPFRLDAGALAVVGALLVTGGALEAARGFAAANRRSAFISGSLTVGCGLILFAEPALVLKALRLVIALAFAASGGAQVLAALRGRAASGWVPALALGAFDLLLAASLGWQWPLSGARALGIAAGLHLGAQGWATLLARPVVPAAPPAVDPELAADLKALAEIEAARRPLETYWLLTLALTFFAVHVGRLHAEWNFVGLISPAVALVGDLVVAVLVAYALILPLRLGWRTLARPLERATWRQWQARGEVPGWRLRLARRWLLGRLAFDARLAAAYASPLDAVRWGLRAGLPVVAVLIALNPIWGFSWYFNSENWASEVWNRWAEARTDDWREAMTAAVAHTDVPPAELFAVRPAGVGAGDFSFIVIGDPGEGDASQLCLHDQLLALGAKPEVKFLVIASDVIYPAGAMRDYEPNFYLPFKGFTKPIYAIPGNHDWFDANEGFNANLLEPTAARAALRARVEADQRLTTTTDARIDALVAEAARLRGEYGLQSGLQRGPYFELQTEQFALIAVDTGVVRRLDPPQRAWLEAALKRAAGKFKFVILGHPLYAAGEYQAKDDEPFAELHALLKKHNVEVVMAGDTHDFEYYREPGGPLHFVNGGGGAYLSLGTALAWPGPPVLDCGFYPRTDALRAKLETQTPAWKRPLWWWVKYAGAWPASVELMSGAFDHNFAPFYQSFVEVIVEPSRRRVRVLPYGARGRLTWGELQVFGSDQRADEGVEFVVPWR